MSIACRKNLVRTSDYLTHPIFHMNRAEAEITRYMRRLADRDLALDRAMIPLGSCTMKLNATAEMMTVGSSASTTKPTRWMPPRSWPRSSDSCPVTTSAAGATIAAIADDLTEDGFVLRYRTGETDDGLSGKEGTFLICSFWLVSALAITGQMQPARDLMERLLRVASPLGLYAEEFDSETGRHLGNFPQAFSHLALMEAAGRIMLPELMDQY